MLRLLKHTISSRNLHTTSTFFTLPPKDHITLKSALQILEVQPDTPPAEIRKKLRSKALKCHPDRFPNNKQKEAEFVKLSRAYAIIETAIKENTFKEALQKDQENKYHSMSQEDLEQTEHYRKFYEFSKIEDDLEDFDRKREISKRVWDLSLYFMLFIGAGIGIAWGYEDIQRGLTRPEREAWKKTVKEARDEWKNA